MRSVEGAPAAARLPAVDVARGAAFVAMALYHFAWDLEAFGGVWLDMQYGAFWMAARYLIAGSFLFLVGVGLVLAGRRGIDWPRAAARLLRIAGGAAAVTVATFLFIPTAFVFFGILHAILLFSLIGLAALRLPAWANLLLGLLVIALPMVVRAPVFDRPELLWIGLGPTPPPTNDFEPVFPWLGPVLLGMACARWWLACGAPGGTAGRGAVGRALGFVGRHALAAYLIHQPILVGAILLWVSLAGGPGSGAAPAGAGDAAIDREVEACLLEQGDVGWSRPEAESYCRCMIARIAADPELPGLDEADQRARVLDFVEDCLPARPATAGGGAPG